MMGGAAADIANSLQQLRRDLASADLSSHDASAVRSLISELRLTERSLTALKVKATHRSDRLAATGSAPDAEEVLLGSGDVSGATARKERDRGRIARDIPQLDDALSEGKIGGEHLDAVSNAAKGLDPDLRDLFDACAGDLVDRTNNTPVDTFRKQVRRLAEKITNDHGLSAAQKQRQATGLSMWTSTDGMGHMRGDFDPELFEIVRHGIARQAAAMASASATSDPPVTKGNHLDALALVELVQGGNAGKGRADITVVVDGETFTNGPHQDSMRETVDGQQLAHETVRRLCCDALIRKVVLDADGRPLDVGRAHRTATPRQWVALTAIYSACAWSGCDRPISWCQAHHITEWERGGPTDLDNLIPLCSRHHHAVHEGQWAIKLLPDRTLRIFRPDGRAHATVRPDRIPDAAGGALPPGRREPLYNRQSPARAFRRAPNTQPSKLRPGGSLVCPARRRARTTDPPTR